VTQGKHASQGRTVVPGWLLVVLLLAVVTAVSVGVYNAVHETGQIGHGSDCVADNLRNNTNHPC